METIIRVKKKDDPYVRLDKKFINNPALSLKAKGLLTYLLSKPDGWDTRVSDIINKSKDQEKSVRSGLKELVENNYTKAIRVIDKGGRVVKWTYIIYERPHAGKGKVVTLPHAGYPQVENPQVENPQVEKVPTNNKLLNKQIIQQVIDEFNNNNRVVGMVGDDFIVVGSLIQKTKWGRVEKKILNMGWVGSLIEVYAIYQIFPKYVNSWVNKLKEIKIDNPAGLLRKSLRTGVWPIDAEQKKDYMSDKYAGAIEK